MKEIIQTILEKDNLSQIIVLVALLLVGYALYLLKKKLP